MGAAGFGLAAGGAAIESAAFPSPAAASVQAAAVPKRPLGRTGVEVPVLALGGSMNLQDRQLLLRQALELGVTYWDTADNYSGGRSEKGIGDYFARYPEDRGRVFLTTKVGRSSPERLEAGLAASLERLRTDYVDLFLVHAVSDVDGEIDPAAARWAEKAKAQGRIRFFGFSTHRNMAECLSAAAGLGWIDAIMTTYNFRVMEEDEMRRAADRCVEAGIGLVAMKTQARSFFSGFSDGGEGTDPLQAFQDRGMTPHQARLKAVWQNPHIASICSHMDTLAVLRENAAAAADPDGLAAEDRERLRRHAQKTASGYCAGCSRICESVVEGALPVADLMRCLMYAYGYNDYQMAREALGSLPPGTRERLGSVDLSAAERCCPRGLALSQLVSRIADDLG
jgi:hypothetical protein